MARKIGSKTAPVVTRAALYLRVSTGRQAESDLSIPDQRRQLTAYCEAKAWPVANEYVEPGNTATDDKRPAFQAMIDAAVAKPPAFNVILVHSFSRFFRDQFQFEFYARRLAKNGVRIVSITQELGDDPMGLMMRQIMNLFDEYQSRENAKHTLRAMKENARQGFWNGARPPIGYRIVAAETRGAKTKKKLEIDPVQADKIQLIYRLALHGEHNTGPMGLKAIATHLNEKGLTTRDGGRWGISSVHNTLTTTTYIGEHIFNKRSEKTGEFKDEEEHVVLDVPPIVTREQFDAVQRSLSLRSPKTAHSQAYCGPTLLGGIIFCGKCGGAMTLRTGKGNGGQYRYYTCCTRARVGNRGCGGLSVRMDRADAAVINHLETRLLDPKRLASMMDNIVDRRDAFVQRRAKHIADLRKMATETDAKLQRLYQAIENGVADASDPSLKARLNELRDTRDSLQGEAQRAAAAMDRMGPNLTPDLLRRFAEATRVMLRDENGIYRRDLLKAVAQRIEVTSKTAMKISGCKVELLRTLSANNGVEAAALDVRTREPEWRALQDSNLRPLA
ncbi:recombinase family protein [uncultured Caulobacter sp.]|uniref:recombinase family protein n=1 Tax=uncultured Caulobacter sp. TaxID=158749 RepID=UPI002606CC8F|nr:recombinase family protein [uncultured Caulobacter sp.]